MAEYLIQDTTLTGIADAIRTKADKSGAIAVSNMASEILNIPSGTELNFKVVGGTSAPSNPTENTIWVNTPTTITGYCFASSIFNSTIPIRNGWVVILVDTSSPVEFNALKENCIKIYPISVVEYVDGAFVDRVAKSYQDGKWVDWITYLYNKGDLCTARTGGWSGSWTNANGCLSVTASGNSTKYVQTTVNKVALTAGDTLTVKYKVTQIDGLLQTSMRFGITSTKPASTSTSLPSFVNVVICDETKGQANLSIGSSGEYYVVITAPGANTTKTEVYEIIKD